MNKGSVLFLSIFLFVSIAGYSQSVPAYTPPETAVSNLANGMVLHKNLRYAAVPDSIADSSSDRLLDIYLPALADPKASAPLFVFIHGGGFTGGDKAVTELCTKIAAEGYAVASINYRLTLKYKKAAGSSCSANMSKGLPKNGKFHPLLQQAVRNASQDAAMALDWLQRNAANYQLDTRNIVICGGSAGAMTALHLAYVAKPANSKIKAVVNFWGGLEDARVIKKGAAPMLTYHGDLDDLISVDYAHALSSRMEEIGSKKSQLKILEGRGHAQYKLISDSKIPEIVAFLKSL
jgi:para-nitrobenzyl esterase